MVRRFIRGDRRVASAFLVAVSGQPVLARTLNLVPTYNVKSTNLNLKLRCDGFGLAITLYCVITPNSVSFLCRGCKGQFSIIKDDVFTTRSAKKYRSGGCGMIAKKSDLRVECQE